MNNARHWPVRASLRDEASNRGSYYNLNRYYDADSGQYLSPDPIGMAGGIRPQGYVDNPMEWVDPLGLAKASHGSKEPSKPSMMQKQVERGQAPREIQRVDRGHIPGQEPHIHYKDGTSSNQSGGVHDAHKGTPRPSKKTIQWITGHGWTPPID